MAHTYLDYTPLWSDYQTTEQYFGLLSFDPGAEESICYVDGETSDWEDITPLYETADTALSLQYDEKFIYLLAEKKDYDMTSDRLYIPFDITPQSGSTSVEGMGITFDRPADFLLILDGKENSRILVQERYDTLHALNGHLIDKISPYFDPPASDSTKFVPIHLLLAAEQVIVDGVELIDISSYDTGHLTYGNANPKAPNFNSLADFIVEGDFIEIKIPWGLLNFSNPSMMTIHDDYYEHYGVENLEIEEIHVGLGTDDTPIQMLPVALEKWHKSITYHERLKASYYMLQDYWRTH